MLSTQFRISQQHYKLRIVLTWKEMARQKMSWKAKVASSMARKPKAQAKPMRTEIPTAFWRRLEICWERDTSLTFKRLRMTKAKMMKLWSRMRAIGARRAMNKTRPGSRKQLGEDHQRKQASKSKKDLNYKNHWPTKHQKVCSPLQWKCPFCIKYNYYSQYQVAPT